MIIAVEGPTCSGKSTLIDRLAELVPDAKHIHCSKPKELTRRAVLEEYVLDHEDYRPGQGSLIFDRLSHGEVTYAPIYRPDTNRDGFGLLGKAGWRWVEMFLASRGAAVGMLTADNDTLAQRLEDRGDDHVTNLNDLLRISSLYEISRRESMTVAAIHNTSTGETTPEKYEAFVQSLLEEARRREEAAEKVVSVCPGYIGPLTPDALLLGDARNIGEKHGEMTRLPFLPIDGNSGEFLLNALPDLFWRGVGIVNASETPDIEALWNVIGRPRIVALGNNAEACLIQQDFSPHGEFVTLPHPQWTRRFAHDRQREYGKAIREAAQTGKVAEWRQ